MSNLQQMNVLIPNDLFKEIYGIKNDFIIKKASVDGDGVELSIIGVNEDIKEMNDLVSNHWDMLRINFREALEKYRMVINEEDDALAKVETEIHSDEPKEKTDKEKMKEFKDYLDNNVDLGYWFPIKRFTKEELEELEQLAETFKKLEEAFGLNKNMTIYFAQHYIENYSRLLEIEKD